MKKSIHLILACCSIIICSCTNNNVFKEIVDVELEDIQRIKQVRIIGPFNSDDNVDLERIEGILNDNKQSSLNLLKEEHPKLMVVDTLLTNDMFNYAKMLGTENNKKAAYYLRYCINSKVSQRVVLLYASKGGTTIWHNREKVFNQPDGREYVEHQDFVTVNLTKGKNYFVLKNTFEDYHNTNARIVRLVTPNHAKRIHHYTLSGSLFKYPVVKENRQLQIVNPVYKNTKLNVKLFSVNNVLVNTFNITFTDSVNIDLSDFKDGVYMCKAVFDTVEYQQFFVLGSPDEVYKSFAEKKTNLEFKKEQQVLDLNCHEERIEHLLKFSYHLGQRYTFFDLYTYDNVAYGKQVYEGASKSTVLENGSIALPGELTSSIKVISRMNTFHTWNCISEVRVFGRDRKSNSSESVKIAEIEESSHEEEFVAENVLDNNYFTTWESEGDGEWLRFYFDKPYYTDSIQIAWKKSIGDYIGLRRWQNNISWILFNYGRYISALAKEQEPYSIPGKHLAAYKTKNDEYVNSYMVFTPKKIPNDKRPIILAIPVQTTTHLPFIKSLGVTHVERLNEFQLLAEQSGFYFLKVHCRSFGAEYAHNLNTELDIILNQVSNIYNVDTNNIVLMASCGANNKSIQYMNYYPGKFKGIASFSPLFTDFTFNHAGNSTNHKQFFISADKNEHVSVEQLYNYIKVVNEKGYYPNYKVFKETSRKFYGREYLPKLIHRLKDSAIGNQSVTHIKFKTGEHKYNKSYWVQANVLEPRVLNNIEAQYNNDTIKITTSNGIYNLSVLANELPHNKEKELTIIANNNLVFKGLPRDIIDLDINPLPEKFTNRPLKNHTVEGPILHAFANKFVLVSGTGGSETENRYVEELKNEFMAMWRDFYFGECYNKKDTEINNADIANSNLILIGNTKTNKVLKQISGQIPLGFTSNELVFNGNSYSGKGMSILMVYPNPLNPERYIVVCGAPNILDFKWRLFPGNNAHKDYFIYKSTPDKKIKEVYSGYFNLAWGL